MEIIIEIASMRNHIIKKTLKAKKERKNNLILILLEENLMISINSRLNLKI